MIPLVCALCYLVTDNFIFVIGYCVSLAEAFSDTCASGFGSLSKSAFDPFKMRRVPVGLSGGMSIGGTIASLFAPILFLLIPFSMQILNFNEWIFCSLFAFVGALIDSCLGSLLQCKFECELCGKITEKNMHCEQKTKKISGVLFITNDAVNLVSAALSVVLAIVFYINNIAL